MSSTRRGAGHSVLGVSLAVMLWPPALADPGRAPTAADPDVASGDCVLPWPTNPSALPLVAEHRYTVSGKARPLLFFWIGRDNVGSARIARREAPDGTRVFEFSARSNPERAPGGMNRWGFIVERVERGTAQTVGMMTESDEETIKEAEQRIEQAREEGGTRFKTFRAVTRRGEACASSGKAYVGGDVAPDSIDELVAIARRSDGSPDVKRMALPRGAQPGFVVGFVDLIDATVEAYRRDGTPPDEERSVTYIFDGRLFDLVIRRTRALSDATFGDRTYDTVLSSDFELQNRVTGWKTRFVSAYGAEGELAGIPVYFSYQPRWWVKVELAMQEGTGT